MNVRTGIVIATAFVAVGAVVWSVVAWRGDAAGATAAANAPADIHHPASVATHDHARPGAGDRRSAAVGSTSAESNTQNIPQAAADTANTRSQATSLASRHQLEGLKVMSAESERHVAEAVAQLRAHDSHFDDLQTLLEIEPRDQAWADAMEARISAFLRVHGAEYSGLEVAPPRCTETLCEITAMAVQGGPGASQSGWHALMFRLFSEAWFQQSLIDPRVTMTGRDGAVIHIATFLRKPRE